MSLKNDQVGRLKMNDVVEAYYSAQKRFVRNFLHSENEEWGSLSSHYLIDRRHVLKLTIGSDRGTILFALELGIGPHYFSPANFWSYEKSKLFRMDFSEEAIIQNLILFDTFLESLE